MIWMTSLAMAGCEMDTDCKGDRVCEVGVCTSPVSQAPAAPSLSPTDRQSLKLVRDGKKYRYRGQRVNWSVAEGIVRTYSRSDETLRKGRALKGWTTGTFVVFGTLAVSSLATLPYTKQRVTRCDEFMNCNTQERSEAAYIAGVSVASWSAFLMLTVTMPIGLVAGGARNRSVERFNRAVERGDIVAPAALD